MHFKQAIRQKIILLYSTLHLLFMDLSVLNSISPLPLFSLGLLSYRSPCFLVVAQSVEKALGVLRLSDALWLSPSGLFTKKINISNYRLGNEPTHTHIHSHQLLAWFHLGNLASFELISIIKCVWMRDAFCLLPGFKRMKAIMRAFDRSSPFTESSLHIHKITTLRLVQSDIRPWLYNLKYSICNDRLMVILLYRNLGVMLLEIPKLQSILFILFF